MRAIALHNRDQFLSLLRRALTRAVHAHKDSLDPRTHQTLEQMLYAIIITGTTRLNRLAQFLLPLRQARQALYVEKVLSTALHNARYNETALFHAYSRVLYQALPTPAFETYRGRRILVIAPTTYEKRTRQGKRGRSMQYPTPLKDLHYECYPKGYVDVWAGVVLKKRQWLPLARRRFSSTHPDLVSQNQVEEQVLTEAISCIPSSPPLLVIGDRGLGRKAMLIWLLERGCDGLFRLRRDVNVTYQGKWCNVLALAHTVKPLGRATWRHGNAKRLCGQVVVFRACLLEDERVGPEITLVVFLPANGVEPLILGTTLRVETLAEAQEMLGLYEKRWVIETGFEMLKGSWGLEKFMVRQWRAAERLLNLVAMAFALRIVLMQSGQRKVRALLAHAIRLLEARSAFKTLTVGKLREALALGLDEHREAWYALLR